MDPAMLAKMGINVDVFGELNAFGDPAWYQGFNNPKYYNETHKQLRAALRKFMDEEVMDNVHEWDESYHLPPEIYKKVAATNVLPMCVGRPWPKKHVGECPLGYEPDYFHELIMYDEMARSGSTGFLWGLAGGLTIGLPPVLKHAQPDVAARVCGPCLKAEKFICLAITEPMAGSDVANLRCTAVKQGDHYIVNGEKKWITNGVFADYFTVAVRTGTQKDGMKGLSLLLIEKTMPGVSTRHMKCTGAWASGTTYITFDDVKVPVTNLLGKENKAFKIIMGNFNHERFSFCAMTNRFSRVCFEDALIFAKKRRTFGVPLLKHQMIAWKLAEMARLIESTQAWLEFITYQMNTMKHQEATMKLGGHTALLKVQCSKVMEYCTREAAQIFGGLSYSRGGQAERVERLCREVKAMAIPGGSEEIMMELGVKQSTKISELAQKFLTAKL